MTAAETGRADEGALLIRIAHDFNNLLTAINGHAELIRLAGAGTASSADASAILMSARQAAVLARELLAVGRLRMPAVSAGMGGVS